MRDYRRSDPAFSLCGLCCALCPMHRCPGYPCPRLTEAARFDSFVPHRNQLEHLNRWAAAPEDFWAELAEKSRLLTELLEHYNDGRHKSFFCTAVNLLPAGDTAAVVERLDGSLPLKERAAQAVRLLNQAAEARGISLKLNKKPKC